MVGELWFSPNQSQGVLHLMDDLATLQSLSGLVVRVSLEQRLYLVGHLDELLVALFAEPSAHVAEPLFQLTKHIFNTHGLKIAAFLDESRPPHQNPA
jgi:hypothetical protein